jgi:hypothetical protein
MGFLDLIQNGVDGISGLDGARVENNFPVGHFFAGNLESVHDAAPVGEDGRDVLGALKIRHTHNVSRSICSRLMKLRRTLLETHTPSDAFTRAAKIIHGTQQEEFCSAQCERMGGPKVDFLRLFQLMRRKLHGQLINYAAV